MAPKYYNREGVEQTETWAVETYGIEFLDAGPGKKFALVEVREKEGPTVVRVNVFNEQSGPQYDQPVAQSWPTLGSPSDVLPFCEGSISCWSERCMFIRTGSDGSVEFEFAASAIIGGDGGPLAFWVMSPSLKSDGLAKVGWLGGTNHRGMLHLVFKIVDSENGNGPEPETGQRQRVLDKAEKVADTRVMRNADDVEAAGIYLSIANTL